MENLINSQNSGSSVQEALSQLESVANGYLQANPNITINNLSSKCGVSEPTLRRIVKGQLKRLPNSTIVLKLLSYISKKNKIKDIIDYYPGPLMTRLEESMSIIVENEVNEGLDLSEKLEDPIAYIIYRLASSERGLQRSKVIDLYGKYGETVLNKLVESKLIKEKENAFVAQVSNFTISQEHFTSHFKATADFIKPENLTNSPFESSQIFFNCSSSINMNAYKEILKIQRKSIVEIAAVLSAEKSKGEIPAFVIGAIDTLDNESAFEIDKKGLS